MTACSNNSIRSMDLLTKTYGNTQTFMKVLQELLQYNNMAIVHCNEIKFSETNCLDKNRTKYIHASC